MCRLFALMIIMGVSDEDEDEGDAGEGELRAIATVPRTRVDCGETRH